MGVWAYTERSHTGYDKQLTKIPHSTLFGLANAPSTRLAEILVSLAGMHKVFYTDNGSTAIEVAMKMALQYWHNKGKYAKTQFISLKQGYHGDTVGAMSLGYIENFSEHTDRSY